MSEFTRSDIAKMSGLGYRKADYADLSTDEVAAIIASKRRRPGSSKAAAAVASAIGMPGLPAAHTDEGIEARQVGKAIATGFVIQSDHERDCLARAALRKMGSGVPIPTDEIAQPFVDANPELDFRWMTKAHCKQRGTRGWDTVYKDGKKVTHLSDDRWLACKSKEIRAEQLREYREAGLRASQAARETMDTAVERMGEANKQTGSIRALNADHPIFNR